MGIPSALSLKPKKKKLYMSENEEERNMHFLILVNTYPQVIFWKPADPSLDKVFFPNICMKLRK